MFVRLAGQNGALSTLGRNGELVVRSLVYNTEGSITVRGIPDEMEPTGTGKGHARSQDICFAFVDDTILQSDK